MGQGFLRTAGLVVAAGAVVVVLAVLVVNRVVWRGRDVLDRRLLLEYCDIMESRYGQKWAVTNWVQRVDVQSNGDVRQRISFSIVVLCDFLDFCTFHDAINWAWPRRYQRRVKAHVRSVEVGGEGGTRFDFTSSWLDLRRLRMVVHLNQAAPRGSEVHFSVDLFWPAKCRPLMRGRGPDSFLVSFAEPVPFAQYVITLPVGERASFDRIGASQGAGEHALVSAVNASGQFEITLTVRDVPAYQKFGVRLDLA
ncbi:hypothetical protein AB0G02_01405 [Actinosynnema sp. NPDC023658]|uniref:hypothetical protein n=1 Tax=Actinosynnema sp. NPDC023658 TaxID=3155465 RepID=UPI0033FAA2D2